MKITEYFSYHRLDKQAKESGRSYSFWHYVSSYLCMGTLTALTSFFYGLHPIFFTVVIMMGMALIPILAATYLSRYEKEKQFHEVDVYLHQMIYSFQRYPKIQLALEDTQKIVSGKMKYCIEQALQQLSYGTTEHVYKEALAVVEQAYPCARMETLHRFFIKVEEKGGRYEEALAVLLLDADHWTKRVYGFQEEVRRVRRTTTIGIGISFLMASASVLVNLILKHTSDMQMDITQEWLYQLVSAGFLIFCIAYYAFTQVQYNFDWFVRQRSEKSMLKDYQTAFHTNDVKIRKKIVPVLLLGLCGSAVFFYMGHPLVAITIVFVCGYLFFVPVNNKRAAFRRLKKDLYYDYADWLRDVALNLSESPLQVAIEDSYEHCPVIMKESLEQFIFALEDNPSDVTPYYAFLSQFEVFDISSSVRILYAVNENSAESIDRTVQMLIQRNYELLELYETGDQEDRLVLMKFSEYIPTFFVAMKVAADMLLVLSNYL